LVQELGVVLFCSSQVGLFPNQILIEGLQFSNGDLKAKISSQSLIQIVELHLVFADEVDLEVDS